jgi:hypothetical protein
MKVLNIVAGLFLLLFVFCSEEAGVVDGDGDKEFAQVFFSDITLDIDVEEQRGTRPSAITTKSILTLGPGIRVLILDGDGNSLRLDIENASQNGLFDALVEFKNGNTIYNSTGPTMSNVSVIWRGNLEICEFYFTDSPPAKLFAGSDVIMLDSLKIQALREDDF